MEAYYKRVSDVFSNGGDIHYILPHFQREYTWEKEQWETLINDLLAIYDEHQLEKEPEHFLGSLVVVNDGTKNGTIPAFKLVDGQQRLITISLILCVLRDLSESTNPALATKIKKMLVNDFEVGEVHFKVFPSTKNNDRATYDAIINCQSPKANESRMVAAYSYLYETLSNQISNNDITTDKLYTVLINCFQVVFIQLNNQNESPYKIFESLNAKGKPLTQADLVANYIAMKLPSEQQEKVFQNYWTRIEALLHEQDKVGQVGELTAFLRHYLAMRRSTLYYEEHIYDRFRDYIERDCSTPEAFIEEIGTMCRFAEYYDKLRRPEHETNSDIRSRLIRLNTLEISTAYPLLLAAYDAQSSRRLTTEEFVTLLSILENYMVRRYICAWPTNFLNKWFPTIWREIEHNPGELTITEAFCKVMSEKYYPSDKQIQQAAHEVKLYSRVAQYRAKIILILETIELHLWAGTDVVLHLSGNSTVEHIMPQKLTEAWKTELGKSWARTYEDNLHTLGNLTLVTQGKNSQLSNLGFARKKQILTSQGFRLNGYFSKGVNVWNENAISNRANWLIQKILEIWPSLAIAP